MARKHQTAANCEHDAAQVVESRSDGDWFVEHYECPCGAEGTISGNESERPSRWDRSGEVFRDE